MRYSVLNICVTTWRTLERFMCMCMCVYHRHIHDNTHRESKTSDADTMRTKSLQCSFLLFLSPLSLFHLSFTRFYSTLSSSLSLCPSVSFSLCFLLSVFHVIQFLSSSLSSSLYLSVLSSSHPLISFFLSLLLLIFTSRFFSPLSSLSLSAGYQSPSLTLSRKANKPCRRKLYSCFRSVSSFLAPIYISFCPFPILSSKLFPLSPFLVLW